MRRGTYRNTGSAWAAGLGLLGLLITTSLIIWMFSAMAGGTSGTPGGVINAGDKAKELLNGAVNQHNDSVNSAIDQPEKPTPTPVPVASPAPAAAPAPQTQPAPVASPAAAGTPSGGQTLGPISPVSPVAPIQEGPGPNLKGTRGHVDGVNNAVDEHNRELEKAMEEK